MSLILHMEYKALNLLDEVCSVEMAIMEDNQELHILDAHQAVSPTYHFGKRQYELTTDFYQMVQVLMSKKILFPNSCKEMDVERWLDCNTIYFYAQASRIFKWKNNLIEMIEVDAEILVDGLYLPYVKRVTNFS